MKLTKLTVLRLKGHKQYLKKHQCHTHFYGPFAAKIMVPFVTIDPALAVLQRL